MPLVRKIISGGQTGVDRAALDFAISVGLPHGGKVPRGFAAEDGTIDRERYPGLVETPVAEPEFRTEQNVQDSDGTLVITDGSPDRGTVVTIRRANELRKPHLVVDLSRLSLPSAIADVREFVRRHRIDVLNVAGPRESHVECGIYQDAFKLLATALAPETPRV